MNTQENPCECFAWGIFSLLLVLLYSVFTIFLANWLPKASLPYGLAWFALLFAILFALVVAYVVQRFGERCVTKIAGGLKRIRDWYLQEVLGLSRFAWPCEVCRQFSDSVRDRSCRRDPEYSNRVNCEKCNQLIIEQFRLPEAEFKKLVNPIPPGSSVGEFVIGYDPRIRAWLQEWNLLGRGTVNELSVPLLDEQEPEILSILIVNNATEDEEETSLLRRTRSY